MTENETLDASLGAVDSPKAVSETQSPLSSNVSKPPSKQSSSTSPQAPPVPAFPPPKTDKPRPHVCTTCGRSFARLEHLKRHERSHTKEKPFECQACTRCFARRDLLLRHQQKLHSTTTPSSRPRNGRRESVAGVANGRVRKNSIAGSTTNAMRPRANTLSHIDAGTLGMLSGSAFNRQHPNMHTNQTSFSGMSSQPDFGYRSMGLSHSSGLMGLPRIDTHSLAVDTSSGLRTAPPYGGFGVEFDMDMMGYTQGHSSTINPHELHTPSMHGLGIDHSGDFGHGPFTNASASQAVLDDDNMFEWVTNGFDNQLSFVNTSENAIESSPSAMSTNSPANFQENANPRNKSQSTNAVSKTDNVWQTSAFSHAHMVNSPAGMDVSAMFFDVPSAENTISPKSLLAQSNGAFDVNFPTPPEFSTPDQMNHNATTQTMFNLPFKHEHFASTASSSSVESSMRHNSIASPFGEIVTNRMRNTLITSLSMHHGFGQRRQSVPVISSPLSSHKHDGFNIANFPSTSDLQRYAAAYFQYCHPHLPFLHLPTMNFESVEYQSRGWGIGPDLGNVTSASPIGGCCLLLAIAAMGALFEHESSHSKSLFEHSKRMISGFLEGRRQSQVNRSSFLSSRNADVEDTPLWLVQAMLLNVVYGHNCGDKTAADIASNQCAALVSLARGADLTKPYLGYFASTMQSSSSADARNMTGQEGTDLEWLDWKHAEERKRTLYAIFVLSSMLVMAYNRPPALTNSEVRLDLPCDEEFWAADSAASWKALGGGQAIKTRAIPFAGALTHLLTAALREHQTQEPAPLLKPSSFGCLVLIDALHNYIWETRQRHLGRQWTPSEIESMHAHIEPALRAWMTAWSSNPVHVLERPNPFGAGPLPADSIPLLDLAYVRLFVDFGRSKEAYWQRDYDTMAQELANRAEPGLGRRMSTAGSDAFVMSHQMMINNASVPTMLSLDEEIMSSPREVEEPGKPSRRERHLRRAAFYAADHLWNADRLGVAFGEQTSRDLPMQSILCACDCAQVLAEWVTTLQERVGRYVGVLGDDEIDVHGYPLVNMLDEEDAKLLSRMEELLAGAEHRVEDVAALNEARRGGYGGRILALTSQTMSRAALWPVTRLMAQSLNIQARHVQARVQSSTLA